MAVRTEHLALARGTQAESQGLSGLSRQQTLAAVGLGLIVLLGAFLRFYELGAYSIGNTYYAATVQSMLTSWHNFFYAAFEPGGSVTVDKPPLGFWVQAVSSYFLGVNGFALALPQALAGVLSIPLLYTLVKRHSGVWAGLAAGLALAVMPVTVATERNNTIDGLLVFVLLLAAWAFIKAVETGRLRHLLLGAFLVGLGFNIKMLQAFMPLPAFYALYFFGARHPWWKRILHLAAATVVLLAVSLSWAIAVDLTPAENRPFIGSSTDNTVMELIIGHNGLRRLGLMSGGPGRDGTPARDDGPAAAARPQGDGRPFPPPPGGQPGQLPPPAGPGGQFPPPGGQPPGGPGGGNRITSEVGEAGVLRLFTEPLATEASWLLPLVLLGIPLVLVVHGWSWPLSAPLRGQHLGLLLWAGWLLPEIAYFSFTTGLFHAYYLIMLGPPLAALVGATVWALGKVWQRQRWLGWALLALLSGVTVAFEIVTLQNYPAYAGWVTSLTLVTWLAGVGLLAWWHGQETGHSVGLRKGALALALISLIVAPLTWSALTAFNTNPNVALPTSGVDGGQNAPPNAPNVTIGEGNDAILSYLLANTDPDSYLLATLNARGAAPYILATSRPVLTFGGFSGSDDVVDVEQLAQMVADGELRFVLGPIQQKQEIAAWVADNCTVVNVPVATISRPGNNPPDGNFPPRGQGQTEVLYDCGSQET